MLLASRQVFIRILTMGCLVSSISPTARPLAGEPMSVHVRVVRLEGDWAGMGARRVAVRVFIGSRRLYQTPWVRGPKAEWNRSLRAFTAAGNPLRFDVVAEAGGGPPFSSREKVTVVPERPAPGPFPSADPDRTLAKGFEELVADYETGPSPPPVQPSSGSGALKRASLPASAGEEILCHVRLAWPPDDGEHRLACGGMTLVVGTRRMAGQK